MGNSVLHAVGLLFVLSCASSTALAAGGSAFRDFARAIPDAAEIAVILDLSDGHVEKVKETWSMFDETHDGKVTFGVIDGSGYESSANLGSLKDIGPRMKGLEPSVKPNASSSDLFRYLLKTMSLMAPESRVLLFTGRMTGEGPLQKACIDKIREKRTRLFVVWTGESLNGSDAIRSLAEASNGSFDMVADVLEEISTEDEETSREDIRKPVLLSNMVAPSDAGGYGAIRGEVEDDGETIKKYGKVRFPEAEPEEKPSITRNMHGTNLSLEKQLSSSTPFIPIRVEVSSSSSLDSLPGSTQQIQYDVKNNLHVPIRLGFAVVQPQNLKVIGVQPQWYVLQPLETVKVDVSYQSPPTVPEGGEGMLTFVASTPPGGITPLPTQLYYTSTTRRDTTDPKVSYTYMGDCRGHDRPDTCDSGKWTVEAIFQDENSGLKKVLSEPYGLNFKLPFTAGTKQPVTVLYTASCCQPKIEIWAEDGQGNYVKRSLDVNNQGLLVSEIAAIVLGVLLLICVIIGIIVTIVIVKRRKQNKLIIPRYQGST